MHMTKKYHACVCMTVNQQTTVSIWSNTQREYIHSLLNLCECVVLDKSTVDCLGITMRIQTRKIKYVLSFF